jgi:hypothetical protein
MREEGVLTHILRHHRKLKQVINKRRVLTYELRHHTKLK